MTKAQLEHLVLDAIRQANLARDSAVQLDVSPTATVFGAGSPLDSLGLVSLAIDIEDLCRQAGHEVSLSDERAVSQTRSPFRTVPTLVDYLSTLINGPGR